MATGKFGNQLDALAYASIDGANDLLTICDVNGDDAGTGPEDKKIAAVEFLKRMLGTNDLSWMSSLTTISSVDGANDFILVFDTSATAFKKQLAYRWLDNTLAGTSLAALTAQTLADIDAAADYFNYFDASASAHRKMLASELLSALVPHTPVAYTSTPNTVTAAQSGQWLTNYGATQVIVHNLPAGASKLRYRFSRIANYAMQLDPNGSETVAGGGAGKYLQIDSRGSVEIAWAHGAWEVVGGSAVFSLET